MSSKISALTPATTPLAGTELLPIVQSGSTVRATVANITGAGTYAGSFTSLTSSGNTILGDATSDSLLINGYAGIGSTSTTQALRITSNALTGTVQYGIFSAPVFTSSATVLAIGVAGRVDTPDAVFTLADAQAFYAFNSVKGASATITNLHGIRIVDQTQGTNNYGVTCNVSSGTNKWNFYASGTADNYAAGNWKFAAAKGVNFTANTPAAGMTSQLLNWYEEGTWTPNQGAGLTLVGAFSSTGRYTRIGRQVSISGTVTGATSVAVTAAGVITSNLPFTVVTAGHGDATNVAINASATVICTGTSVTAASAIAATATITFSATYFV